MRITDIPAYAITLYLLASTSLAVHEFAHIYAAQYIAKDCIFTETRLTFDMLFLRRSGMTYFTCSHGVVRESQPKTSLIWEDFTLPTIQVKVAEASGIRQITSPLTTGWFTALLGPILETTYLLIITDWLTKTFKRLNWVKGVFPLLLLMVFWSSRLDFQTAMPEENKAVYAAAYVLAYALLGLAYVTSNREYYRKSWTPQGEDQGFS